MPELMGASGGIYAYNLYAYCENDPVGNADKEGQIFRAILRRISPIYNLYEKAKGVKSIINYFKNKRNSTNTYEGDGTLIFEQWDLGNYRYGITSFDKVGCEVISVYNAMVLLGYKPYLSKVILEFENNGSQWLWGTMGTNPYKLNRYFMWRGIKSRIYFTVDSLKKNLKNGDVIILSRENYHFFSEGIHTIAIKYQNGKFIPYNDDGRNSHEYPKDSIESLLAGRRFLVAYIIGR